MSSFKSKENINKKEEKHIFIVCYICFVAIFQEPIHLQCIKPHLSDYLCKDKRVNKFGEK